MEYKSLKIDKDLHSVIKTVATKKNLSINELVEDKLNELFFQFGVSDIKYSKDDNLFNLIMTPDNYLGFVNLLKRYITNQKIDSLTEISDLVDIIDSLLKKHKEFKAENEKPLILNTEAIKIDFHRSKDDVNVNDKKLDEQINVSENVEQYVKILNKEDLKDKHFYYNKYSDYINQILYVNEVTDEYVYYEMFALQKDNVSRLKQFNLMEIDKFLQNHLLIVDNTINTFTLDGSCFYKLSNIQIEMMKKFSVNEKREWDNIKLKTYAKNNEIKDVNVIGTIMKNKLFGFEKPDILRNKYGSGDYLGVIRTIKYFYISKETTDCNSYIVTYLSNFNLHNVIIQKNVVLEWMDIILRIKDNVYDKFNVRYIVNNINREENNINIELQSFKDSNIKSNITLNQFLEYYSRNLYANTHIPIHGLYK